MLTTLMNNTLPDPGNPQEDWDKVLKSATSMLRTRFNIFLPTIQVEPYDDQAMKHCARCNRPWPRGHRALVDNNPVVYWLHFTFIAGLINIIIHFMISLTLYLVELKFCCFVFLCSCGRFLSVPCRHRPTRVMSAGIDLRARQPHGFGTFPCTLNACLPCWLCRWSKLSVSNSLFLVLANRIRYHWFVHKIRSGPEDAPQKSLDILKHSLPLIVQCFDPVTWK